MTRIVAITSGIAGVGKTQLSLNLALHCAKSGMRTCLIDTAAEFDHAPGKSLRNVIDGACQLQDIIISEQGIDILSTDIRTAAMNNPGPAAMERLARSFAALEPYELILLDISSDVLNDHPALCTAIPEIFLVITPEPTALTEAYALVKQLRYQAFMGCLQVIVNQAQSEHQAQHTFEKFREVVRVYQGIDLALLGIVLHDRQIAEGNDPQRPMQMKGCSEGHTSPAFAELADRFLRSAPSVPQDMSTQSFWMHLSDSTSLQAATAEESQKGDSNLAPMQQAAEAENVNASRTQVELDRMALNQERSESVKPSGTLSEVDSGQARQPAEVSHRLDSRRTADNVISARFIRNEQRSAPIDALKLRRVVGRMLVKATLEDEATADSPVKITVDQLQVRIGNEYNLRPGRYTHISLHCQHIHKPDTFIEEIFSNCAISGCKVRHLGSQVRYWVTSDRDGCILLDGDDNDRNCVQVYMASGGNSFQDTDTFEPEAIPRLRRVTDRLSPGGTVPGQVLGRYPHQRIWTEDADGEPLETFRVLRRDLAPLVCAFHKADGISAAGHLCESSP